MEQPVTQSIQTNVSIPSNSNSDDIIASVADEDREFAFALKRQEKQDQYDEMIKVYGDMIPERARSIILVATNIKRQKEVYNENQKKRRLEQKEEKNKKCKYIADVAFGDVDDDILELLNVNSGKMTEWNFSPPDVAVSTWLDNVLKLLAEYWKYNTETSKRTTINMYILSCLVIYGENFPDKKKCAWEAFTLRYPATEGEIYALHGQMDLVITDKNTRTKPKGRFYVVTEIKGYNLDDGICQLLGSMYACKKSQPKEEKIIFGILTNGKEWQFYQMDNNLKVTRTAEIQDQQKIHNFIYYIISHESEETQDGKPKGDQNGKSETQSGEPKEPINDT